MVKARVHAPARGIAPGALACAFALLAMVAQIASYTHPELIAHVPYQRPAVETVPTTASSTLEAVPKTQRSCDADDDADDDNDDDDECALAHGFVGNIDLASALPFAGRVVAELSPPRPLELLLVAPKNSPPNA